MPLLTDGLQIEVQDADSTVVQVAGDILITILDQLESEIIEVFVGVKGEKGDPGPIGSAPFTAKGDLLVGGVLAGAPTVLPVGASGRLLTANPAVDTGVSWEPAPVAGVSSVNTQTGAVVLTAANVGAVPTTRQVIAGSGLTGGGDLTADRTLTVNFGTAAGTVVQGNDVRVVNAIPVTLVDAKGDLLAGTADNTVGRVAVGTENKYLRANSLASAGMDWVSPTFAHMDAASVSTLAQAAPGTTFVIKKSGGVWPSRPTARTDLIAIWVGAEPAPTIGGAGNAIADNDHFWKV